MKKMIKSTLVITALLTSAEADFSFGELYDDMKEVAASLVQDQPAQEVKESKVSATMASSNQVTEKEAVSTH